MTRYDTLQFQNTSVSELRRLENGHIEAVDSESRVWTGRKLVLANGSADAFPDIPGYADCWGYSM